MTAFLHLTQPKPQGVVLVAVAVEDDGAVMIWSPELGLYTREGVGEELARKARAKARRFDPMTATVVE